MDTRSDIYNIAWESEEHTTTIRKERVPPELRRFKVVLQCDIKELPSSEEVELSFRRVVYGQVTIDPTVQDASENGPDLYGLQDVLERNSGPKRTP